MRPKKSDVLARKGYVLGFIVFQGFAVWGVCLFFADSLQDSVVEAFSYWPGLLAAGWLTLQNKGFQAANRHAYLAACIGLAGSILAPRGLLYQDPALLHALASLVIAGLTLPGALVSIRSLFIEVH